MAKNIKHVIKGIGSIMDISPSSDYGKYISRATVDKRLQSHFERAGQSIKLAIIRYSEENEKKE